MRIGHGMVRWAVCALAVVACARGPASAEPVVEERLLSYLAESVPADEEPAFDAALGARVAEALARLGDAGTALAVARELPPGNARTRALATVACVQAHQGSFAEARETAAGLPVRERVEALAEIGLAACEAGEAALGSRAWMQAEEAAATLPSCESRVSALVSIAMAMARCGAESEAHRVVARALEQARAEGTLSCRSAGLAELAVPFHHLGQQDKVDDLLAESFEAALAAPAADRPALFAQLARAQAGTDRLDDLVRTARALQSEAEHWSDPVRMDRALMKVARDLLGAGAVEEALQQARLVWFQDCRDSLLLEITLNLARRSDVEDALLVAASVGSPSRRTQAVLGVAEAVAEAGQPQRAVRVAESIALTYVPLHELWTVRRFRWDDPGTWLVPYDEPHPGTLASAVSRQQIAEDLASAAMRFERTIGAPEGRDYAGAFAGADGSALSKLSRAQTATGDPEGALEWAMRLEDTTRRVHALVGIAEGLLEEVCWRRHSGPWPKDHPLVERLFEGDIGIGREPPTEENLNRWREMVGLAPRNEGDRPHGDP